MKIGIRADGSSLIGFGHIMRCSAIAKELVNRNVEIIFITKENESVKKILEEKKLNYINLKISDLDKEITDVVEIIKENNIDYVLTDSYGLSDDYLLRLRMNVKKLICIDDNSIYIYPSHMIINGNIFADKLNYRLVYPNTKLLLGTRYVMLREEFTNRQEYKTIEREVKSILITMGGTDVNNFTPTVIEAISVLEIETYVIIGTGFKNISQLYQIQINQPHIHYVYNPKNIKDLMLSCDIAISAGGNTSYELTSLGIPTILIKQAENQANVCSEMSDIGISIYMGNFLEITPESIRYEVVKLINNFELRRKMNYLCKQYIFKDGVKNIVDEILQI